MKIMIPFMLAGMWITANHTVFAQVPNMSEVVPAVSDVSTLGFLGWYCWYVTSRVIPSLAKTMQDESREARANMQTENREARIAHNIIIDKLVESQHKISEQQIQSSQQMADAMVSVKAHCESVHGKDT